MKITTPQPCRTEYFNTVQKKQVVNITKNNKKPYYTINLPNGPVTVNTRGEVKEIIRKHKEENPNINWGYYF